MDFSSPYIVRVGKNSVLLDMHSGYPGMDVLYDPEKAAGKYLRKYIYTNTTCHIQEENNQQIPYRGENIIIFFKTHSSIILSIFLFLGNKTISDEIRESLNKEHP